MIVIFIGRTRRPDAHLPAEILCLSGGFSMELVHARKAPCRCARVTLWYLHETP